MRIDIKLNEGENMEAVSNFELELLNELEHIGINDFLGSVIPKR